MRIRSKLLFLNLIFLTGFAATTFATYLSVSNMRNLNLLARRGLQIKNEFVMFIVRGQELIVSGNLDGALKNWLDQNDAFKKQYEGFAGSKLFGSLPGAAKKLESFSFISQTVQTQIGDLSGRIRNLIAQNNAGGSEYVVGLMQGYEKYGDMNYISALSRVNSLSTTVNTYMTDALTDMINTVSNSVSTAEGNLLRFIVALALLVMAISSLVFSLFAGRLGKRLGRIGSAMAVLKGKNFSVHLEAKGKDELSDIVKAFNGFMDDFSMIINGVKAISAEAAFMKDEVTSATEESSASITEMTASIGSIGGKILDLVGHVNRSNLAVKGITENINSLTGRIEGQLKLIELSASSVEQINASISNVAGIAENHEKATVDLVSVTKNGGSMVDGTNAMIQEIANDIEKITQIVGIIDDISDQTNLLSMNAAIEAAHAGNAGRGFSIVADEIRKLADSTQANSKNIKAMIKEMSEKIENVLVKSASSKVAFFEVDREVASASRSMSEIASAMQELSSGSSAILNATQELSGIAGEVGKEVKKVHFNAESVLEDIRGIEEIGTIVKNGMIEIEAGTKDINSAMVHVSDLQAKSGESIEKLNLEVSHFKTRVT